MKSIFRFEFWLLFDTSVLRKKTVKGAYIQEPKWVTIFPCNLTLNLTEAF